MAEAVILVSDDLVVMAVGLYSDIDPGRRSRTHRIQSMPATGQTGYDAPSDDGQPSGSDRHSGVCDPCRPPMSRTCSIFAVSGPRNRELRWQESMARKEEGVHLKAGLCLDFTGLRFPKKFEGLITMGRRHPLPTALWL